MIILYHFQFTNELPAHIFEKYMSVLPDKIIRRIMLLRKWQDAHACLFGKLLLIQGLRIFKIESSLLNMQYNIYNRPYLNDVAIDFNISHSGNTVVCAISDEGNIGIDIEEVSCVDLLDYCQVFQDEEWSDIISSNDPYKKFFSYWTKKEAAVKADGRGLSIPLNEVLVNGNSVYIEDKVYQSFEIVLSENYKCHLATENEINSLIFSNIKEHMTLI